jgi:hypothetical protein
MGAVVAAVAVVAAHAAAAQQIGDPIEWTRGFAERLVAQGGQAAYEYWADVTRGNFNAEGQQQFRGVLVDIAPQAGAVRRVSTMTEERADDRFLRVRALYHLGANPFQITFYFYRPDSDWRLMSWVTTSQSGEIVFGPPRSVPVGVAAPAPAPAPVSPPAVRSVK